MNAKLQEIARARRRPVRPEVRREIARPGMTAERKKGIMDNPKIDPVRLREWENAADAHSEALRLRSILARIADMVGARGLVLGRESQVATLAEIERRLGDHGALAENMHWREYAWLSCPHPSPGKYGDDGEMQCTPRGGVQADFRRGKIEDLSEHLRLARHEGVYAAYEAAADELFPEPN